MNDDVNASCDTASTISPRSSFELADDQQPQSIFENLRIGKTLGQGASCKVKIAKDNQGNKYAIKILNRNKHFRRFIEAEVQTLSHLRHPNIVNLVEHGSGMQGASMKPFQYILLELANSGSLFDYVT